MNLLNLIQQNQDILEEPTYDRFDKAEHIRWLNRAIEDMAMKTKYFRSTNTEDTSPGVSDIAYPSNAVTIIDVYYNGEKLGKVTREYMDGTKTAWQSATGAPSDWFVDKEGYFTLYPIPDDTYEIVDYYISIDDALTNDDDVPNMPASFHAALCYFACREMAGADEQREKAAYCGGKYKEILSYMYKDRRAMDNMKVSGLVKPSLWSS